MKPLYVGILSLFGGVALAVIALDKVPAGVALSTGDEGNSGASVTSIESRLLALEEALAAERSARQLLEDELFRLMDDDLVAADSLDESSQQPGIESRTRQWEGGRGRRPESREERTKLLVEAGFDEGTADWILTRESEARMEELRLRYEARRNSEWAPFRQTDQLRNDLRQNLGDAGYEQYLAANGQSLHVSVGSVLDSSPAQTAGLRPGDQIVNYGGTRVYNMYELTQEIMQGPPDERVVVDVLRDGAPMQVVLPRGPIGITGR